MDLCNRWVGPWEHSDVSWERGLGTRSETSN